MMPSNPYGGPPMTLANQLSTVMGEQNTAGPPRRLRVCFYFPGEMDGAAFSQLCGPTGGGRLRALS
jgi:hypothetical protein